jgi:thymidylate synthase
MKEEKDNTLQMLLSMFNNIELKEKINEIINLLNSGEKNNSLLSINMININPFNSIYYFNYENNNLSCNVEHIKGNILTEIIYNIMFTSLMVIFIAKIINFQPYMINYKCKKSYYIETDNYIIDKIAWNVPDVLPLLKLADKDYKNIDDYSIDDLIFLGLFI